MIKKPKKIIAANWKMNVTSEKDAVGLFTSIKNVVSKLEYTQMVCCPPHMYVNQVAKHVDHKNYRVGGQDAYAEESGSRTKTQVPNTLFLAIQNDVILKQKLMYLVR
jgi:triosephosphate isomerase